MFGKVATGTVASVFCKTRERGVKLKAAFAKRNANGTREPRR
jgi:hypothetical protein